MVVRQKNNFDNDSYDGDVMNAALPANFKLASETKIILHPEVQIAITVQVVKEEKEVAKDA